jgi:hypothetical protein
MSPQHVLRTYFHAKDENRPHLLAAVFCEDARLEIHNRATGITFPAATDGLDAIADVLVSRFNQTYENIYSFYMARPAAAAEAFTCDWLVGMTEKSTNNVRIGCGRYDWTFQGRPAFLATRLVITIESMVVLQASAKAEVMQWLLGLNYPWASAAAVETAPVLDELAPVLKYIGRTTTG